MIIDIGLITCILLITAIIFFIISCKQENIIYLLISFIFALLTLSIIFSKIYPVFLTIFHNIKFVW